LLLTMMGCSNKSTQYQQADIYKQLREKAFSITAKELKIDKNDNSIVYGMIMETGYPEAVASLIAMGDGSVSLYFSNGGGIIGIGEHDTAKRFCLEYLAFSNDFVKYAKETNNAALPHAGETVFYFWIECDLSGLKTSVLV
jgi:hypothetical protein